MNKKYDMTQRTLITNCSGIRGMKLQEVLLLDDDDDNFRRHQVPLTENTVMC